jgi:Fuc2NAc and GlcNAc transferase
VTSAVLVFLAAGLASVVATGGVIPLAWRLGFVDRPTSRSSHQTNTPRGGGLGILCGLAIGIAVGHADFEPVTLALLAGALTLALIGAIDDRRGVAIVVRLFVHLIAAALLVVAAGPLPRLPLPHPFDVSPGWLATSVSLLWIVGVVNVYNFLDGIDGLAGLQGVITSLAIAVAAWNRDASIVGLALGGGCLGFLVWNWSPARVFMGDLGSGAIGFLLAGLPFLAAPAERPAAVFVVALSLCFFLADATLTLGRRIARRERIWEAHREHCYQRIVRRGSSHGRVVAVICTAAGLVTVLGVAWWQRRAPALAAAALLAAGSLFAIEAWTAARPSGAAR